MVMIYKATPRAVLKGIRDESGRALTVETSQLPQHLPVYFLLTQISDQVSITGDEGASVIFGDKTFDPMSPYYNHQTVGAVTSLKNANQAMIVPIKLKGSKKASIRLGVELVAATVDGVDKTRVIWHATPIGVDGSPEFMEASIIDSYREGTTTPGLSDTKLGALVDSSGMEYYAPSAYFPIIDMEVEAPGDYGNDLAMTIEAPTMLSANPTDSGLVSAKKTFIYRLSLYKKSTPSSNPTAIYSKYSDTSVDFVLKPDFVHNQVNMSFGEVITEHYQEVDDPDRAPTYGPFPNVAVYQDNIELVAQMLGRDYEVTAINEASASKTFTIKGLYDTDEKLQENLYLVNIFTGEDISGRHYATTDFSSARKFGGIRFGRDAVIYAQGGTDNFPMTLGVVDKLKLLQQFDSAVRDWCDNFNDVNPLFDSAKYPFSNFWDTGFSLETKKSLMKPVGQHKRLWSTVATHIVADYDDEVSQTGWRYREALTGAEEITIGMILRSYALLIPESVEFGTPTVRVGICGRSGMMVDRQYRGRLPLTIELIDKVSAYFGNGNAILNSNKAFDVFPNNRVSLMNKINITYQSGNVYNESWDAGIMWVQNADINVAFFPAFRTVYPDDTSVLTSYITMICACYMERVCEIIWRKLVGNGKLTDDEFIEESDKLLAQELNGKFDNRFKIVPRTYYTSTDETLGYRWSTDIEFYANNMKTVGLYTITSRRMSEYASAG